MTSVDREKGSLSGRATTFEEFLQKLDAMNTAEGVEKGLDMALAPTDIVVAPFGKSGTTWLRKD